MLKAVLPMLLVSILVCSSALADEGDTQALFNGKDLSGWEGNSEYWSVEDGAITGRTTSDNLLDYNTFLIWKNGKPGDFELTFQYRIVGGNSGVQYRSKVLDQEKYVVGGYQADVDSSPRFSGINYDEKGRGILAERGQKVTIQPDGSKQVEQFGDAQQLQQGIRPEQWNNYRVVARGNRLQHYINDQLMSEVIDKQEEKAAERGVIALQLHAGPPMTVQFKDLQLKEMK